MSSHVPDALRRRVIERASGLCEYCLVHESDTGFRHQVEHIISEKHGGATIEENLAAACVFCNRFKGSDIATLVPGTNDLVRLFNPRRDSWPEHFALTGARIEGLTPIGAATALLLCVNLRDRLSERAILIEAGRFPSEAARGLMGLR